MSNLDEGRYGRACLLILNICPYTLRHVISDYYIRHGSLSIQDFLEKNKHALFHLRRKRCCCRSIQSADTPMFSSQWDSLYMKNSSSCRTGQRGDCPCQYDAKPGTTTSVMDITLCCLFIKNICLGITFNMAHVDTIREVRNNLIHAGSACLDEPTFLHYWNKVENAIIDIALHVSPTLHSDTKKMVKDLENQLMNTAELAEELKRLIVDEKRIQVVEKNVAEIEDTMNTKMMDIEENMSQTKQRTTELEEREIQNAHNISQLETAVEDQRQEFELFKDEKVKPRTEVSSGKIPDINKLTQRLIEISTSTTLVIPISPVQERGEKEMPLELLYASVVIREDHKYAKKGHNSEIDSLSEYNSSAPSRAKPTFNWIITFLKTLLSGRSSSQRDIDSSFEKTGEEADPADLFLKDGKIARNIYMLGDAAHGKTTYCMWLLKKWCNAQQRGGMGRKELDKWEIAMKKFDFVFLVKFRNVNPSRASVIDMICDDVFSRDIGYHAAIRHVLSSDKYRSLIIMDGLDEWNPNEETSKRLTFQGMPNIEGVASSVSCFISMRPWVFPMILNIVEVSDRVIEIHGLSETGMKKVIENVLLNHYRLEKDSSQYTDIHKRIVRYIKDKRLKSFMQIPLLAVVCVQIWYNGEQVGDSMTSFYTAMLNMLIERAQLKRKTTQSFVQTTNFSLPILLSAKNNIKNCINVLIKLGKVAYEDLVSKETKLVFEAEKIENEIGKRELQFALDVGLISQKGVPSTITKNVSVHFFHKSIQEFLAAIYILTQKEVSDLFCKHLSNVKVIMKLSNVIMFICGMSPFLGSVISQCVVSVTDSDTAICKYRESAFYRGSVTVTELYKVQVSWYRELQYGQTDNLVTQTERPVTQIDNPVTQTDSPVIQTHIPVTQPHRSLTQTDSPVTFHVSDVYLASNSDTETVRMTREFLSDHHVDIRSLWLQSVPVYGECGITNTELDDFLSNTHNTRSLFKLSIDGYCPGRSVPTLCIPTLRCLRLEYIRKDTHLDGNICPPLLTDMKQLRVLELYKVTLGKGEMLLSPDMVHIERIYLQHVTLGEGGLGLSPNMVHIERIVLENIILGEGGLGLSPEMVHIEEVVLRYVHMPAAEWGELVQSASNIHHRFKVVICTTSIDIVSMTNFRSSPDFTLTRNDMDIDMYGRYELEFTRVWPPLQLTHGDE